MGTSIVGPLLLGTEFEHFEMRMGTTGIKIRTQTGHNILRVTMKYENIKYLLVATVPVSVWGDSWEGGKQPNGDEPQALSNPGGNCVLHMA